MDSNLDEKQSQDFISKTEKLLDAISNLKCLNDISLDRIKIRNKGRRMKIYIKLTKEESEAYQGMLDVFSNGGVNSPEEVAKTTFIAGMDAIYTKWQMEMQRIRDEMQKVQDEADEADEVNKETSDSGIIIPGPGSESRNVEPDPED